MFQARLIGIRRSKSKLLNFPAGKHDDQVDALGLIGQVLDRMGKGTALPSTDQKPRFMNEMTMDEAWTLARPKRPDLDHGGSAASDGDASGDADRSPQRYPDDPETRPPQRPRL